MTVEAKNEERRKAVQRLQEKYLRDAAAKED